MKYPIRYFSIGLLTASLIVLIGYFLAGPPTSSIDGTVDEMIDTVEKEGYRVISESEYISLATTKNELNALKKEQEETDNKNDKETDKDKKTSEEKAPKKDNKKDESTKSEEKNSDKKDDNKNKDKDKDKDKKDEAIKFTLVVEQNMVPSEISKILEDKKIIKSANDFNQFMESNNYSPYLQIGEFKLNSDMSMEEIAKVITNK